MISPLGLAGGNHENNAEKGPISIAVKLMGGLPGAIYRKIITNQCLYMQLPKTYAKYHHAVTYQIGPSIHTQMNLVILLQRMYMPLQCNHSMYMDPNHLQLLMSHCPVL